ncbi:MAG: hypothetical protein RL203_1323, partial [Pseudomonadota bacterium]
LVRANQCGLKDTLGIRGVHREVSGVNLDRAQGLSAFKARGGILTEASFWQPKTRGSSKPLLAP